MAGSVQVTLCDAATWRRSRASPACGRRVLRTCLASSETATLPGLSLKRLSIRPYLPGLLCSVG